MPDNIKDIYTTMKLHNSELVDENNNPLLIKRVSNVSLLPSTAKDGELFLTLDTDVVYMYDAPTSSYKVLIPKLSLVHATRSSNLSVPRNAYTQATFTNILQDTHNEFVNNTFVAKSNKLYLFEFRCELTASVNLSIYFYKNGLPYVRTPVLNTDYYSFNAVLPLNVNDTVDIYLYQSTNNINADILELVVAELSDLNGGL